MNRLLAERAATAPHVHHSFTGWLWPGADQGPAARRCALFDRIRPLRQHPTAAASPTFLFHAIVATMQLRGTFLFTIGFIGQTLGAQTRCLFTAQSYFLT